MKTEKNIHRLSRMWVEIMKTFSRQSSLTAARRRQRYFRRQNEKVPRPGKQASEFFQSLELFGGVVSNHWNLARAMGIAVLFLFLAPMHAVFGQTTLLSNTLRGGSLPSGWTQSSVKFATAAGGYANFTATSAVLTTPVFDASAHESVDVATSVAKFSSGGNGPVTIEYSLNGGSTWTVAGNTRTPTSATYLNDTTSIDAVSSTMRIRFTRASSPSQKRLRDVVIRGIGSAAPPTAPEISIESPDGNAIASGGSRDSFGAVTVGSSADFAFVVRNTGTATLNVSGISFGGTHSGDFSVVGSSSAAIAADGSANFTIRFAPAAAGARSGTVTFANDDSDEGSYLINLSGSGSAATTAPVVTTSAADPVGVTSATLNGNVNSDGGATVTERGFVYSATATTPTIGAGGVTKVTVSGTTGAFDRGLTGLAANQIHYFRAYAINSVGTTYGGVQSFTTLRPTISSTGTPGALTTDHGAASASTSVSISGANLISNISATAPSGFEVSNDDSAWGSSATFTKSGDSVNATLYIRLAASGDVGARSGNVTLTSTSASAVTVAVSGTVGLAEPTANAASNLAATSFDANWTSVSGATGYILDVATNDTFSSDGGGGSESFENHNATGSYGNGNYVGDDGVTWYYVQSRDDAGYPIDNKGILMRRSSDNSRVYSASIPGGIGSFTCELRKGFTGSGNRQVELFINGVSQGTSATFGNFSGADTNIYTFEVTGINISGNVEIRVDNITAKQVVIDNISWTPYPALSSSIPGYDGREVGNVTTASVTGLTAGVTYYYRVKATAGAVESDYSNTNSATPTASPRLAVSGSAAARSTTYGTASASTSVSVSGSNLTANITATAPAGFEVSNNNSTWSSSTSFTRSGGNASGTLYIRLAANTAAGSPSGNVTLSSTDADDVTVAVSGTVSPKGLTITGLSAQDKPYDATTSVTVSGTPAYSGLVLGQSFSVSGSVSWAFPNKTVGSNKTLTRTGSYTAPNANYTITAQPSLSASITARTLTVSGASADNKVYDGSTTATISGASLVGVQGSDTVGLTGGGSFASATVGAGKPVTASLSLTGADAGNYSLTQPAGLTASITAKALTINGATATSRAYDGTTDITVSGGSLSGVVGGDDVTLGGTPAGSVASAAVGNSKSVTVTGYSLGGADAGNYSLSQPSLTANITAAALTVTANDVVKQAGEALSGGAGSTAFSSAGLIGSETIASVTITYTDGEAAEDAAGVYTNAVVPSSATGGSFTPSNYSITYVPGNLTVTAAAVPEFFTNGVIAAMTTTYGTASSPSQIAIGGSNMVAGISVTPPTGYEVSLSSGSGFATGVVVNGSGTIEATTVYLRLAADADANTYNDFLTLSSSNATPLNIQLPQSTVSAKALTISNPGVVTKVYDNTTSAMVTGTLSGVVNGDSVSFTDSGSTFASANAGTNNVTASLSLTGADAANYSLTTPTGLTGVITPKALTVSGAGASNKVYDATTTAVITNATLIGVLNGDVVTVSGGGTFASANVGTDIAVSAALTLGGAQAGNYSLTQPTGLSADITAKTVTVSGITAADKIYDGSTTATLDTSGASLVGNLDGGNLTLNTGSASGAFSDADVGTDKTVSISGLTLGGSASDNYSLTQPTASADITVKALSITANNVSKDFGQTLTGGSGSTAFTSSGLVDGETIGSVTITYGNGAAADDTAGLYADQVTPSAATGGSFDAANYDITYVDGDLTVNAIAPTVTTTVASETNSTSAVAGGNVTSEGGGTVTNRGVVYATSANPTVADAQAVSANTGTGAFSVTLTNLTPGATYYYRAFAQNSADTVYGDEGTLTALCFTGVVTGLDVTETNDTTFTALWSAMDGATGYRVDVSTSATFGVVYPAVDGGESFANLNASGGSYETGSFVGDDGLTWNYENARLVSSTYNITGTSMGFSTSGTRLTGTTGTGGVASITYSVRSYFTGGTASDRTIEVYVGDVLRESFTLPAMATVYTRTVSNINLGRSVPIEFRSVGTRQLVIDDVQWTGYAEIELDVLPTYSNRTSDTTSLVVTGLTQLTDYYIRVRATNTTCTSDYSATGSVTTLATPAPPTVETATPSAIGQTGATLGGEVVSANRSTVTARGVVYNTSGTPTTNDTTIVIGSGTGVFSQAVSGLTPDTTYYVRAYAENAYGVSYGAEQTFTTLCFDAPVNLRATATNLFDFTAAWDAVSGASSYRVDVSTSSTFSVSGVSGGLIISEVMDGNRSGGIPKYVEITYAGAGSTNVSGLKIRKGSNGNALSDAITLGDITLSSGESYVIANSEQHMLDAGFSAPDLTSGNIDGNGNDVYALTDAANNVIDIFGTVGTSSFWYQDSVATRSSSVQTGTSTYDETEWTVASLSSGEPDGGAPGTPGTHTLAGATVPSYIPGYSNRLVAASSVSVTGLQFSTTYYVRLRTEGTTCVSTNSGVFSVTTPTPPPPQISEDALAFGELRRPVFVYGSGTNLYAGDGADSSTNRIFAVTDAWLANLDATRDLQVHIGAWDANFGLARTNNPPSGEEDDFTRLTIANWFTNNYSGFDFSRSSANATSINAATNAWRFTSALDGATIQAMMDGGSNRIAATIVNTVGARLTDQQFGYLRVDDDDSEAPQLAAAPLDIRLGGVSLPTVQTQALVAAWNFNDANDRLAVSHGAGGLSYTLPSAPGSFGGSALNLVTGDEAGSDISIAGADSNDGTLQFEIDMTARSGLVMTFAARRSSTGHLSNRVDYAVNGGAFTTYDAAWSAASDFALNTFDFSATEAINGAGSVVIRITFANSTGGNTRFDNVQFTATQTIYQITDAQLANVGAGTPLDVEVAVYDAGSGLASRALTIDGVTTNSSAFDAGLSSADTASAEAVTVWRFTSPEGLSGQNGRVASIFVTAVDADNDRIGDALAISNRFTGALQVIDNDTEPPVLANIRFADAQQALRPFQVAANNVLVLRSGTGTDSVMTVTDGMLANAGDVNLRFAFGAIDAVNGIARPGWGGAETTNNVINISVGNIITGDFSLYDAAASGANATNAVVTNVWRFSNDSFTAQDIQAMFDGGDIPVTITLVDDDNNLAGDQAISRDVLAGAIRVTDDDTRGPVIRSVTVAGAFDTTRSFYEDFESENGWSGILFGSWTNTFSNGLYQASGNVQATTLAPVLSGVRRIGLATNEAATETSLELPPFRDPGIVSVFAGRFAGDDVAVRLEYLVDGVWSNAGARTVTAANPDYEMLSWTLDQSGIITTRLVRAATGPQVYLDDLVVMPVANWISADEIDIQWAAAVDDQSGVDEYRIVAPAMSSVLPAGTNAGVSRAFGMTNDLFSIAGQEGVITGYVFAIDGDDDRADDRSIGNIKPIVVRVDTSAPPAVASVSAANDLGDVFDTSSEIRLSWVVNAASEVAAAGPRASDGAALSPFRSYRVYYTENAAGDRWPSATDPFLDVSSGFADLADYAATNILLTGLTPGTDYRLAVAGVDEAGNIGPLSNAQAMVRTTMFDINNAYVDENNGVVIEWTGPANSEYDVIYADAEGYAASINGAWQLAATLQSNRFVDTGDAGSGRAAPLDLPDGMMRFYRVAPMNAWVPSDDRDGIASSNVAAVAVRSLRQGNNIIGFPVTPFSNTMASVFGLSRLPAGSDNDSSALNSTLFVYTNSVYGDASTVQFALVDGVEEANYWRYTTNGSDWVDANDLAAPLSNAVSLRVPESARLLMAGRVKPFDAIEMERPIELGMYNMITLEFPFPVKVNEIPGLRQTQGYVNQVMADRIVIINNEVSPPVARYVLYRRSTDNQFMYIGGGSAENHELMPGEAIVFRAYPTAVNGAARAPFRLDFTPNEQVRARYPDKSTRLTNSITARPSVSRPMVSVSGQEVLIKGNVNPHRLPTTYWFRYGTDGDALTNVTPVTALEVTNNRFNAVSQSVGGFESSRSYIIELVASNALGTGRSSSTFAYGCPEITVSNNVLPALVAGQPYTASLSASGGEAPYTFALAQGMVPAGLTLEANGILQGTPTSSGSGSGDGSSGSGHYGGGDTSESGYGGGDGGSWVIRITDAAGCSSLQTITFAESEGN
jgi:hypothetical protein